MVCFRLGAFGSYVWFLTCRETLYLGYLNLQPLKMFVLPILDTWMFSFSVNAKRQVYWKQQFCWSCPVFSEGFAPHQLTVSLMTWGFLLGAESSTEGQEQWASTGTSLTRRGVTIIYSPFFLKRQQTVIETELQQLVKHSRSSTHFHPAPMFRLQLLQINARPQMVLPNPQENPCPGGSSYRSRPLQTLSASLPWGGIIPTCMSFTSSSNTKTQEVKLNITRIGFTLPKAELFLLPQ